MLTLFSSSLAATVAAKDLYEKAGIAALASDVRAANVGDILTVVIFEQTEARNQATSDTSRTSRFRGSAEGGGFGETGELSFRGEFSGRGARRQSESLVAQISVSITQQLANGDYMIAGQQNIFVNGEKTRIEVRGRVRDVDIMSGNRVLSTNIAEAEISYNGNGFVSRSARPGLINRIFRFLGLA